MSQVRKSFNKASSIYNENAFLQNEIATRLSEKLKVISVNPEIIIDLGSGTGFLSEKTAKIFPDARLVCVDFAQQSFCLLYTSPSPRDQRGPRMPSSA